MARDAPLIIEGVSYPVTCVGIALGCFDFILGVDFLRTLGPLTWDFDTHTVSFQQGARRVTWQCEGSTPPPAPQHLLAVATSAQPRSLLDRLLQQHGAIFEEPQGLPPARPYDHRIHLLPMFGSALSSFSSGFSADPADYSDRYPHLDRAHLLPGVARELDRDSFELALAAFVRGL